jgi:hypothetical protein
MDGNTMTKPMLVIAVGLLLSCLVAAPAIAQVRELCVEVDERTGDFRLDAETRERLAQLLGRSGFRAVFHGPPGTGKPLTTTFLENATERLVYRLDLRAVVSRYIGETEKNLSRIFEKAEESQSILVFDEADALFGRRTEVRDAHARHANQEIAHLLNRMIAGYRGPVIVVGSEESAELLLSRPDLHFRSARTCRPSGG